MRRMILGALCAFCGLTAATAANSDTLTVRIPAMHCAHCAHKVRNILKEDAGVSGVQINLERHTATIAYDAAKTCTDSIQARLTATKRYLPEAYSKDQVLQNTIMLRIDDMHCKKCADRISSRLQPMEGVDSIGASIADHYITVRYDANRTSQDDIRALITKIGYTPVSYYKSPKAAYAYYLIPAEQANSETVDQVLALDNVNDVNVSALRKSLAVTYLKEKITSEQLLQAIQAAGIKAVVPAPHECKEGK